MRETNIAQEEELSWREKDDAADFYMSSLTSPF
jgi:hypothetical protein